MSTSQFWFVFHQLLPLLGIPNSFSPAPKLFSTVYGTLAVVRDKFFFGGSKHRKAKLEAAKGILATEDRAKAIHAAAKKLAEDACATLGKY